MLKLLARLYESCHDRTLMSGNAREPCKGKALQESVFMVQGFQALMSSVAMTRMWFRGML